MNKTYRRSLLEEALKRSEKQLIEDAIIASNGVFKHAAQLFMMPTPELYRRAHAVGVDIPATRERGQRHAELMAET